MIESSESTNRRPRRSKAAIEAAIQKAATAQIKKKGFAGALVTDIVKHAKIEPIVFYNRYKNLDEFYDSFVKRFDYWVGNSAHQSDQLGPKDEIAPVIEAIMNTLVRDKLMTEMLRWEVGERNSVTQQSVKLREEEMTRLVNNLASRFETMGYDATTLISLIVAGIYYLALLKDRTPFAGIDLGTPEGKQHVAGAVRLLEQMLNEASAKRGDEESEQNSCE